MWEFYDELIEGIDPLATADRIISGGKNCFVRSGDTAGTSASFDQTWRQPILARKEIGMPLRDLAVCVKSWDYQEAALGLAAINAWYNGIEKARALGLDIPDRLHTEDRSQDPFIQLQRDIAGKKVTVVGHFPYIDQLFGPICDLAVIEKFLPKDGDYPEQAAEYLLPDSDYVFISSYTLVEKVFPHYLELAKNAVVIAVGAGTPITPILHSYGVDYIAGFVLKDIEAAERVALGLGGSMHGVGQKINLKRA
ncbi:MAG: DUF364 domain-containing protein [Lachnospiraceae bacterium]|jgi:uncharacterized protein (DUF4213/DUF364 family)|nr:DUF364 domain-containing protein [Lachnospiraceae bacterium]